jgi:multidrug efflux system membrane fusion protein
MVSSRAGTEPAPAAHRHFILWQAVLVGLLALLPILAGCGNPPASTPQRILVQTTRAEPVAEADLSAAPEYIAVVRANDETDLSFKVGGILSLIGPDPGHGWDEGTPITAQTVLARLKQADFVNAAASARARADLAQTSLGRFDKLRQADAISQLELDAAKAEAQASKAQLDQAKQNLEDSELQAPWDGVVLARYANPGEIVASGKPVLRIANTRLMSVELGVPDRLISHFTPGKEIDVQISALQGHAPFKGTVSEVGVAASREGRLFRVVIKVRNPEGSIRSGMTATVRVSSLAPLVAGSILVPLSALVTTTAKGEGAATRASQLAVFVVSGGKALLRLVKTGDIIKSSILVAEGLKAGEEVVTTGTSLLYEGAPVEVLQADPVGR